MLLTDHRKTWVQGLGNWNQASLVLQNLCKSAKELTNSHGLCCSETNHSLKVDKQRIPRLNYAESTFKPFIIRPLYCFYFLFFLRVKTFWIERKRDETFITWIARQNDLCLRWNNEWTNFYKRALKRFILCSTRQKKTTTKKRQEIRLRWQDSFSPYLLKRHT